MTDKNTNHEFKTVDGGLSSEALELLGQPLDPTMVSQREGAGGKQLSYIEAWMAIDQANRIFGYGNWGYRVLGGPDLQQIDIMNPSTGEITARYEYYTATVGVYLGERMIFSDEGFCDLKDLKPDTPKNRIVGMHEMARKGAISDGMKRALRGFGPQFGNSLYGDSNEGVEAGGPACPKHGPGRHVRESTRGNGYYCTRRDNSSENGYCDQTPVEPSDEVPNADGPAPVATRRAARTPQAAHGRQQPRPTKAMLLQEYYGYCEKLGYDEQAIRENYLQRYGKRLEEASLNELGDLVQKAAAMVKARASAA